MLTVERAETIRFVAGPEWSSVDETAAPTSAGAPNRCSQPDLTVRRQIDATGLRPRLTAEQGRSSYPSSDSLLFHVQSWGRCAHEDRDA
ncbi:hypothetical protein AAFF_G00089340 [Aldrovandia affinis]|uniref:Uncharacterized protein n=1 Tax=Aldrovandia affinis TaxID=143900 RepID=A0AAD7RWC4_9TELE|nr:hypothetical protein AAFF_G00089340 [Aldrovandia affinis]